MSRGPDAGTLLARALGLAAQTAGCPVEIATADWTHWASATFTGARHKITLAAAQSPQLVAWLALLPEAELVLRGHLVADLVVVGVARDAGCATVRIEALTVET